MGADNAIKARAHADWLANGLSVSQLVEKYDAHPHTINKWLKDWEEEEISEIRHKSFSLLHVTNDVVENHEKHVATLKSEAERCRVELATLDVGSREHDALAKTYKMILGTYNELSGIAAMVAADKVRRVELAKLEAKEEHERSNGGPRLVQRTPNGSPVVPLD